MKLNGKNGLLNNRYLLYVVLFVAVASLFSYVQSRNHTALLFFLLVALGVNYFNKNMIVVLGSAIVLTNFLASYTTIFSKVRLLEGLVEANEEEEEKDTVATPTTNTAVGDTTEKFNFKKMVNKLDDKAKKD